MGFMMGILMAINVYIPVYKSIVMNHIEGIRHSKEKEA